MANLVAFGEWFITRPTATVSLLPQAFRLSERQANLFAFQVIADKRATSTLSLSFLSFLLLDPPRAHPETFFFSSKHIHLRNTCAYRVFGMVWCCLLRPEQPKKSSLLLTLEWCTSRSSSTSTKQTSPVVDSAPLRCMKDFSLRIRNSVEGENSTRQSAGFVSRMHDHNKLHAINARAARLASKRMPFSESNHSPLQQQGFPSKCCLSSVFRFVFAMISLSSRVVSNLFLEPSAAQIQHESVLA